MHFGEWAFRLGPWLHFPVLFVHGSCSREPQESGSPIGGFETAARPELVFFFDLDCPDCKLVKEDLLAPLLQRFGLDMGDVAFKDVKEDTSVNALLDFEKNIGFEAKELAPVVVCRGRRIAELKRSGEQSTGNDPRTGTIGSYRRGSNVGGCGE